MKKGLLLVALVSAAASIQALGFKVPNVSAEDRARLRKAAAEARPNLAAQQAQPTVANSIALTEALAKAKRQLATLCSNKQTMATLNATLTAKLQDLKDARDEHMKRLCETTLPAIKTATNSIFDTLNTALATGKDALANIDCSATT